MLVEARLTQEREPMYAALARARVFRCGVVVVITVHSFPRGHIARFWIFCKSGASNASRTDK